MANIFNADDGAISGSAGIKLSSDTSGVLNIQTNGTTAISISSSQVVSFPSTTSIGTLYFAAGTAAAPSISVTGDTNTGIYFPGADQVAITTAGTQRVLVDATGNFMVGTTSATGRVSISDSSSSSRTLVYAYNEGSGDAAIRIGNAQNAALTEIGKQGVSAYGATAAGDAFAYTTQSWSIMADAAGGVIKFSTGGNTERARITSAGNFGIGTTAPNKTGFDTNARVLTIFGPRRGVIELGADSPDLSDQCGNVSFMSGSTQKAQIQCRLDGSGNGNLVFYANSTTERGRFDSSGNFLINTTSAGNYRLTVNGSAYSVCGFSSYTSDGLFDNNARPSVVTTPAGGTLRFGYLDEGFGQYNPAIGFRAGAVLGSGQTNYSNAIWATTNGGIAFGTGTAGTYTERGRFSADGALLLNNTDTSGTSAGQIRAKFSASTYSNPNDNNLPNVTLWNTNNSSTSAHAILSLRTGGSGGGDPFISFDVASEFGWSAGMLNSDNSFRIVNGWSSLTGTGVYIAANGSSWSSTSDERVKDIIEPITNAVSKVSSLRTVIGKYKKDNPDKRRAFLIAQDVDKVLPEAVDKNNENEWGLSYTDTIPLLVAAIKELKAELDQLKGVQ